MAHHGRDARATSSWMDFEMQPFGVRIILYLWGEIVVQGEFDTDSDTDWNQKD